MARKYKSNKVVQFSETIRKNTTTDRANKSMGTYIEQRRGGERRLVHQMKNHEQRIKKNSIQYVF
jgi:hypothetical protein